MLRRAFGGEIANETFFKPVVNAGVYAIMRDAPHWRSWERAIRLSFPKDPRRLSDQTPLNYALHVDQLPIELLPSRCNWLCAFCEPVFDEERGLLVEPMVPHDPIGIIHLINQSKYDDVIVKNLQG